MTTSRWISATNKSGSFGRCALDKDLVASDGSGFGTVVTPSKGLPVNGLSLPYHWTRLLRERISERIGMEIVYHAAPSFESLTIRDFRTLSAQFIKTVH